MFYQKIVLTLLIIVCLILGVYFKFFKRPPLDQILAANILNSGVDEGEMYKYVDDIEEGIEPEIGELKRSLIRWEIWVRAMNYVSVGTLFSRCNQSDQIAIGKIVLTEDKETGGLAFKIFVNISLAKDVTAGTLKLSCQYESRDMYANQWDICTMEQKYKSKEQIINCPLRKGKKKFMKKINLPNALPKGHYKAVGTILDQNNAELVCGLADFTI